MASEASGCEVQSLTIMIPYRDDRKASDVFSLLAKCVARSAGDKPPRTTLLSTVVEKFKGSGDLHFMGTAFDAVW